MRIVCGTDLSEEARAGVRLGFAFTDLFADETDVSVEVLHVVPVELTPLDRGRRLMDDVENVTRLRAAVSRWVEDAAGDRDFEVALAEGKSHEQIRARLDELPADYVVVAQTGQGRFATLALGSTAHRLAHDAPTKTWIAHREFQDFDRNARIVVAVDYEPASVEAMKEAASLARHLGVGLDLIHVSLSDRATIFPDGMSGYPLIQPEVVRARGDSQTDLRRFLSEHAELLEDLDLRSHFLEGPPVRHLVEYARNQQALALCLGTSSKSRLERFFLGSVASGVVRQMPCSLLLVPPKA
jgi:nucleotide-binding universal stress UspA family protein